MPNNQSNTTMNDEDNTKCKEHLQLMNNRSIASQANSLGKSFSKRRGFGHSSCLVATRRHQKEERRTIRLQDVQSLQMHTATCSTNRPSYPLQTLKFRCPVGNFNIGQNVCGIPYHYNYSSGTESDPTAIQSEFNQLIRDLSSRVFDLTFQELKETFYVLKDKISEMSENSIAVQDEVYFLGTIQKLMSTSSRLGTMDGAELVERYLTLVLTSNLKGHQPGRSSIGPNRQMFTIALDSWSEISKVAHEKSKHGALMPARRSQQILDFMWEEYHKDVDNAVKPDVIHYTAAIKCLANGSSRKATQQAQHLLKEAEKKSGVDEFIHGQKGLQDLDPNLVPDRACYNTVLYCLARYFHSRNDTHGRGHSVQYIMGQMKEIMERMEMIAEKLNDNSWMPNTATYNLLLMACSRRPNGGGAEAEKILQEMLARSENLLDLIMLDELNVEDLEENSVLPTVKSYNHVINAWSHETKGCGAKRAEEILKSMLRKIQPAKSEDITASPFLNIIYPDVVSFNLVLNAYARSGLPEAGTRSEIILNFMNDKELSSTSAFISVDEMKLSKENLNIRADVISFNSAINAWSKSGKDNGAQRAQALLDQLLEEPWDEGGIMPNSISFSTVMQAWGKSSDQECGSKTEKIFEKLGALYHHTGNDDFLPSESCYHALISAWCNEIILGGREDSYDKGLKAMRIMKNEAGFHPKTVHYNLLLSVPGKSQVGSEPIRYNNAVKARALLIEMLGSHISSTSVPDIYSFNHVIKGFQGFDDDKYRQESLFAVLDTFNILCESNTCNPNAQTYIHVLKAVQDSLEEESNDRACLCEEIFRKCCESGLLTNAVLAIVGNMLPSRSIKRLEACRTNSDPGTLAVYKLPPEWSENRRVGQNQTRNRKRS